MYFDDFSPHSFNMLNLSSRDAARQVGLLMRVGSVAPYAIAVDANFVYLANQHPRYQQIYTFTDYKHEGM